MKGSLKVSVVNMRLLNTRLLNPYYPSVASPLAPLLTFCHLMLACVPEGVQDPAHHVIHLEDGVPVGPVAALALELLLHYEGCVGLR